MIPIRYLENSRVLAFSGFRQSKTAREAYKEAARRSKRLQEGAQTTQVLLKMAQESPRRPQDGPRGFQEGPQTAKVRLKMAQGAPKTPPRWPMRAPRWP